MATKLPKVPVVIVGMGWAGGIIASELTKAGIKVLGLERGKSRKTEDYFMVHDELRYAQRYELMQDLSKETVTFRNKQSQRALPMRSYGSFLMGESIGTASISGFCRMISRFTRRRWNATARKRFRTA